MIVNVLVMVSIVLVSWKAFSDTALYNKLLFSPYVILRENHWYRFITSAWVHADFMHLFLNMYVLYYFGGFLEMVFVEWFGMVGSAFYLFLFIGSVIIAGMPSYAKHKDNAYYAAIGASGGVSGVLFANILLQPMEYLYFFGVIPIPGLLFGILYMVYSQYMSKKGTDNLGHDAHFWGAIGGMALLIAIKPAVVLGFINQIADELPF